MNLLCSLLYILICIDLLCMRNFPQILLSLFLGKSPFPCLICIKQCKMSSPGNGYHQTILKMIWWMSSSKGLFQRLTITESTQTTTNCTVASRTNDKLNYCFLMAKNLNTSQSSRWYLQIWVLVNEPWNR